MKTKTFKINYAILFTGLIFLCAVILATVYDLNINVFLYNKQSVFGNVFRVFGEIPAFILLPFCLNIFTVKLIKNKKAWSITLSVVATIISIVFWYIIFDKFIISEFLPNTPNAASVLVSVVFSFVGVYLFNLINEATLNSLFKFAVLVFVSVLITALLTQAIKLVFGRVRFRYLNSYYSEFTLWYVINGFNGNKSFVSGHTSAAGAIFVLNFLPHYFTKTRKYKPLFIVVSLLYVAATGLSRIIVGAHYLSDVLFGALLSCLVIYFTHYYIFKNPNKISS